MKKWSDNPDAVLLMKALNSEQCYDRLPYPPFGDLMFTDKFFAQRVEELVPDKKRRIKAIKLLRDATCVKRARCQFNEYLAKCA